ncbi:MAG: DNA gyrase subunit A [Clostridia bacterium]|nr:DNA gyrase subunit A [Clostridia bacterium]
MKPEQIEILKNQHIVDVELRSEMEKSFIDYAMSVIVARALPDVRDGLKPVHRRILYTMYEDKLTSDKPYRKSATTVGDVLGRYHPHGDASVYDALVRLAQDFSLRYPLVDGHGNFGSIDGDPPAAYRYTEARMAKISNEMLADIDKDTVDFVPNFDEHLEEPTVLPSKIPCLLVNGSSGIAVGMATNIPPHNLTEVINGTIALIDNPDIDTEGLMEYVKGPDFPTGATIMGKSGIRAAYSTGHGKITVRAKAEIIEKKTGYEIEVTEIPYMVNKAELVKKIAELVKDKRVEGISNIKDVSGKDGLKIQIFLKREANPQVVLNQLYKFTALQDTCAVNMLALVDGQPKVLALKDILKEYVMHREKIVERRTRFELKKAEDRAHILEGLRIACDNIDEIIRIIRSSYNNAKERLMERFGLSDIQAQSILEMQLRRLQGLEREKIEEEYNKLLEDIRYYKELLADERKILGVVKDELIETRDKFGDERRTDIGDAIDGIEDEDLIEREDVVITRSHFGYIKRLPVNTYRAQKKGGRGVTGMTTREEDFVEEMFVANTHSYILFFTSKGRVFRLKGYNIPEAGRTAKGVNLANLLPIEQEEKINAVISIDSFDQEDKYLTMITKKGTVKRTALSEYDTARKGGLIAILLDEDDELVTVALTGNEERFIIGTRKGKAIRFEVSDIRPMGRPAHGVRGILLAEDDYVVGMEIADETGKLLTVTENGFGKRTEISEYKVQARGGKGILNYNLTDKTGDVAGIKVVKPDEDIILISSDGVIIRMDADDIQVYSRVTQGVKVMKLAQDVRVIALSKTAKEEESDEEIEEVTEE